MKNKYIHITAVDDIGNNIITTYCGIKFSDSDKSYRESNTDYNCPLCIAEIKRLEKPE